MTFVVLVFLFTAAAGWCCYCMFFLSQVHAHVLYPSRHVHHVLFLFHGRLQQSLAHHGPRQGLVQVHHVLFLFRGRLQQSLAQVQRPIVQEGSLL